RLFAGHEVLIKPGLVEDVQMQRVATLGGSRYLLLELWDNSWLPQTERVIFDLQMHGIIPILAHPERYRAVQRDPERLAGLLRRGVRAQVTASSLIGAQGKAACSCAKTLLKKSLVHYIASDAHGLQLRPPNLLKGLQSASKLLGDERVHQMTEVWPAIILRNE